MCVCVCGAGVQLWPPPPKLGSYMVWLLVGYIQLTHLFHVAEHTKNHCIYHFVCCVLSIVPDAGCSMLNARCSITYIGYSTASALLTILCFHL